MGPTAKRTLFAMLVVVFLATACVSAPAATQDAELLQIEQTVDALAAQNEPTSAQEPPDALPTLSPAPVEQSADPAVANEPSASTPDPASVALQQIIDALASEQNAESARLAEQAAQATATAEQLATASAGSLTLETEEDPFFATQTQEPFPECKITILGKNSSAKTFRFPARAKLLELKRGSGIIILQPVNLRSGPTLTHRILLTLRPDPSTIPFDSSDPKPTPTLTPRPEIIFKIVGGPAYTTIGDETGDNISFSVSGRKYKWWQIELPNKTTGWIVESSACGQIPFIAKADLMQGTP